MPHVPRSGDSIRGFRLGEHPTQLGRRSRRRLVHHRPFLSLPDDGVSSREGVEVREQDCRNHLLGRGVCRRMDVSTTFCDAWAEPPTGSQAPRLQRALEREEIQPHKHGQRHIPWRQHMAATGKARAARERESSLYTQAEAPRRRRATSFWGSLPRMCSVQRSSQSADGHTITSRRTLPGVCARRHRRIPRQGT
jgi:hypothetical protein